MLFRWKQSHIVCFLIYHSPFGDRCTSIHDTNIEGKHSAWLPRINNVNALSTDYHIDWNTSYNFSLIHKGSPFGKHSDSAFSSYDNFTDMICNKTSPKKSKSLKLSELQRIEIALDMTAQIPSPVLKYKPSHLIFGRLCMIAQVKTYNIKGLRATALPDDSTNLQHPDHVTVHKLIFGHNLSDGDIPPSLWFNLPSDCIVQCSHKDQLRYNRRKARAKDIVEVMRDQETHNKQWEKEPYGIDFSPEDGEFKQHDQNVEPAFTIYYPGDDELSSLITDTMRLKLDTITQGCTFSPIKAAELRNRIAALVRRLEAANSYFSMSYWPVSMDRLFPNERTPVPSVSNPYVVQEGAFHEKVWSSFVLGLNLPKEEASGGNPPHMVGRVPVIMHNGVNQDCKRLKIFDAITRSTEGSHDSKPNNCSQIPMLADNRKFQLNDRATSSLFEKEFDQNWRDIEKFYTGRLQ